VSVAITHLGCAGHLIVADRCRWRRHTQVGTAYRVSSVGNYYPTGGERATVGASADSWFESMVFRTVATPSCDSDGCGCLAVADWCEIESRRYATAGAAQAGHDELVARYAALAAAEVAQ